MFLACFDGDVAPRAVFPLVDDRPKMLGIMIGMDQKDRFVWTPWSDSAENFGDSRASQGFLRLCHRKGVEALRRAIFWERLTAKSSRWVPGSPGVLLPGDPAPQFVATIVWHGQTRHINTESEPPPPPSSDRQVCELFFFSCVASALMSLAGDPASKRAVASFDVQARTADRPHGPGRCSTPQCAAERRSTPTEDCLEVERETHVGLQALMAPPRGTRPGLRPEPGPQRSDRSLGRSARDAPPLRVPVLAAASEEAVDFATLSFLVQRVLEVKKNEEEAEKKEEAAMALLDIPAESRSAQQVSKISALVEILDRDGAEAAAASSSSHLGRRKRMRRRKSKAPKTSSSARVGVQPRRCGQGFRRSSLSVTRVSIACRNTVRRCCCCCSSARLSTSLLWRRGKSRGPA